MYTPSAGFWVVNEEHDRGTEGKRDSSCQDTKRRLGWNPRATKWVSRTAALLSEFSGLPVMPLPRSRLFKAGFMCPSFFYMAVRMALIWVCR